MKTEKELEDIKNMITEHIDKLAHLVIEEFPKIENREIQANFFSNIEGKLGQLLAICASTISQHENRRKLVELYSNAIMKYADDIRETRTSSEQLYNSLKNWMDIPKKNDMLIDSEMELKMGLKLLISALGPFMNSIPAPMPKINKDQIN